MHGSALLRVIVSAQVEFDGCSLSQLGPHVACVCRTELDAGFSAGFDPRSCLRVGDQAIV